MVSGCLIFLETTIATAVVLHLLDARRRVDLFVFLYAWTDGLDWLYSQGLWLAMMVMIRLWRRQEVADWLIFELLDLNREFWRGLRERKRELYQSLEAVRAN